MASVVSFSSYKQTKNKIMIKASELRIGNKINYFIKDEGFFEKEVEIADLESIKNHENCDCDFCCDYYYKYIPLTEEWIKRSNVKKRNGYPYEFLNGYIVLRDGKYYFKYHDFFICVDYVHQLQNLFFVFRGEELVFSTEP